MTPELHPWASDLPDLHAQIWARLARGVRDRRAPTRHPTLATTSPDGRPKARTVVLRAADRQSGRFEIHTDRHSAKMTDLRMTPWAALHVWDPSARLQIRMEGSVTILTGQDVSAVWAGMSEDSKLIYGGTPAPGQQISEALDYRKIADPDAFAILHVHLDSIDVLHLGPSHRRARFDRVDGWRGAWLAP